MDVISELYNICDPLKPASEDIYVDLCLERGGTSVVSVLKKRIQRSEPYAHLLFSGHPGSGKSTELMRLCEQLNQPDDRFFIAYMDASEYIDIQDVELSEILLSIVGSLAKTLREKESIDLEPSYFKKFFEDIKIPLFNDVELDKIKFSLDKIAEASFRLKKSDTSIKQQVRKMLSDQLPSISAEINLIIAQARLELKKRGYRDLVLIIDNLEKIIDMGDTETKMGSYYRIFIAGGQELNSIQARVIYTVPLPLIHSQQRATMVQIFGEEPIVLPMVKVEDKNCEVCQDGIDLMSLVLEKRFKSKGVENILDVFDSEDTLNYLCRMSGGHVRNLLMYFRSASDYVDALPFTKEAINKGLQRHRNAYSVSIPEKNWELLAQLHLNKDKMIPNDDNRQAMLSDLSILEYINGGEPWYMVNPMVRELEKFKKAVEAQKQKDQANGTDSC